MKIESDYIIVGSGLTGATIARCLHDANYRVVVLDRRSHLGGNVHDQYHESGIRFHTYGPHYFRTSSDKIWEFVNRFSDFYKFEAVVKSLVDGEFENWPVASSFIKKTLGENWQNGFSGLPSNFEEASLAMMPEMIYKKFVKGYSEKQWGVSATELSTTLARRFDVRDDDEPRLMRHKYQGLPMRGYADFMRSILDGIPVVLNCDYLANRDNIKAASKLIYTGPIDEYFNFDMGRLKYRGQIRQHTFLPDVKYKFPCGQINNPQVANGDHIRTLEWKHMMQKEVAEKIHGTLLTTEKTLTPSDPNMYEYPFPDDKNGQLYNTYKDRADQINGLLVCGRLGEYRYYDMDQAIARALQIAQRIIDCQ